MENNDTSELPQLVVEYINSVIKAMRYRKKVRAEVRQELTAHFTDAMGDCIGEMVC